MLRAQDVVAGYGELDIVKGVRLEVNTGEIVCVIGPNGAGKSTFLKALFGLLRVRSGIVAFDGEVVTNLAPHRMVAKGVGYVPQLDNVFPNLTIDENLDVGGASRAGDLSALQARVYELFPDLRDRRSTKVGRLSGGQRQMVALMRALMTEPRLLFLDEPSAGLAPSFQDAVFRRIGDIAQAGTAILLVEQNARKALAMSARGYVLDQGRNKYEGPGPELLADPRIGRLYLGGE